MDRFRDDVAAAERLLDAADVDDRARPEARVPRGGAAQDDLVRGTPVELGLRQRGRSLVGGRAGIDEVEPPCPADRAWIDADVDDPADAR